MLCGTLYVYKNKVTVTVSHYNYNTTIACPTSDLVERELTSLPPGEHDKGWKKSVCSFMRSLLVCVLSWTGNIPLGGNKSYMGHS